MNATVTVPAVQRQRSGFSFFTDVVPFLVVAFACAAALIRDVRRAPGGFELVFAFDLLLILGIAWIPSAMLLRVPSVRVRIPLYLVASGLALAWMVQHTPTHAVGPTAGAGTAELMTAFCTAGFGLLTSRLGPRLEKPTASMSPPWLRLPVLLSAWLVTATLVILASLRLVG